MTVAIDYHDIEEACKLFNLEHTDYYIEFHNQVVYMYWVACPADMESYMKLDTGCLDYQVKGKWLNLDEHADQYVERPFTNCRYILEAN